MAFPAGAATFYLTEDEQVRVREIVERYKERISYILPRLLNAAIEGIKQALGEFAGYVWLNAAYEVLRKSWLLVVDLDDEELENICTVLQNLTGGGRILDVRSPLFFADMALHLRRFVTVVRPDAVSSSTWDFIKSLPDVYVTFISEDHIKTVLRPPLVVFKARPSTEGILAVESGRHCPGIAPVFAMFIRVPDVDMTFRRAVQDSRTFRIAYSRDIRIAAAALATINDIASDAETLTGAARNSLALYSQYMANTVYPAQVLNMTSALDFMAHDGELLKMNIDLFTAPLDVEFGRGGVRIPGEVAAALSVGYVMWYVTTGINLYKAGLIRV